jgi:hypothetical protein
MYIYTLYIYSETCLNWILIKKVGLGFNATFNNISAISWQSVLVVGKPEYPEKTTDLTQVTDKLYQH